MTDDIRRLTRRTRRVAKFTDDAACARCGTRDIHALVDSRQPVICYACDAHRRGVSVMEKDHISGKNNSNITMSVPANEHRNLNDLQHDWPTETLRNPDGNPLIVVAAALRRFLDMLKFYIDRTIDALPQAVELLNSCLVSSLGARWWEQPGFRSFTTYVQAVSRG